ncbi:hypothetical protein R1flu_022984 [Riccia fluitans]|uniref:Uncharacterized protein n=1 Tax=Riccia fluitans TaxID=41844 RepID=A0ABD1XQV3_9MARC
MGVAIANMAKLGAVIFVMATFPSSSGRQSPDSFALRLFLDRRLASNQIASGSPEHLEQFVHTMVQVPWLNCRQQGAECWVAYSSRKARQP